VGRATVERLRQRCVEEGLGALTERPRPGLPPKREEKAPARLIAAACRAVPAGRQRWTLPLLADRGPGLGRVVFQCKRPSRTKKNDPKPWRKKQWGLPEGSAEWGAAMEDILEVYAEPEDPKRPQGNVDETSTPLIKEPRPPLSTQPGQRQREDDDYERHGPRNRCRFVEPQAGRRHGQGTAQRTKRDFAHAMPWQADTGSPEADMVRVVLDHLNTQKIASL
jgi:hypothetical protein